MKKIQSNIASRHPRLSGIGRRNTSKTNKDSGRAGMAPYKTLTCLIAGVIILLSFLLSGCFYGLRTDGPYLGRVVDSETREPIEGVVILGTWVKVTPNPGGESSTFHNAKETVTDKNGDFEFQGLGTTWANVDIMYVLIFKSGYEHLGTMTWSGLYGLGRSLQDDVSYDPVKNMITRKPVYDLKRKVVWEGERAVIPLKKLTLEERKKGSLPDYPPSEAKDKTKRFMEEIKKERREQGLSVKD